MKKEEWKREGRTVYALHKVKGISINKFYFTVYHDWNNGINTRQAECVAKRMFACDDLLEALKECMDELYLIHSQYGDRQNARDHCPALIKAEDAIKKATE